MAKLFLIIMVGLIGTGKTTLAQALAEKLHCAVISSDAVRKMLAGIPETEPRYEDFNRGIYSADFTRKVYNRMLSMAKTVLSEGLSVILDASFGSIYNRYLARSLAIEMGAGFMAVECVLDEDILKERLAGRKDTASDGRWEIYQAQKKSFNQALSPPEEHMVVDTAKPAGENVVEIMRRLKGK